MFPHGGDRHRPAARRPWRNHAVLPMFPYQHYPPPPLPMLPYPPPPYDALPYPLAAPPAAVVHPVELQTVMASNFAAELDLIGSLLPSYPYVVVDTEYPGTVHRPPTGSRDADLSTDERYAIVKANVDELPIVQLGITLCNSHGDLPFIHASGYYMRAWEVGFADFDVGSDRHDPQSVCYLRSQGVDFDKARACGVCSAAFGAKLAEILQRAGEAGVELTWVTYGGAYDLGYLFKMLTGGQPLPETRQAFMEQVRELLGGRFFDAKLMAENCGRADLRGVGLRTIAANLGAQTYGADIPWRAGTKNLVAQRVHTILRRHVLSHDAVAGFEGMIDGL